MHRSEVCVAFCVHSRASGACALFRQFSTVARVRASFVSLAHADFITSCIVLCPLEMHFLGHG
jgi:hypothetical protein